MTYFYILSFVLMLSSHYCQSAVLVRGNETAAPFGFTASVNAFAYDPSGGAVYVGLSDDADTDTFAVAYATRPSFSATPSFIGLAVDDLLLNKGINLLALSILNNAIPVALCVRTDSLTDLVGVSPAVISKTTTDTVLDTTTTTTDPIITKSDALNDATGSSETTGIISLAANDAYAFAAVKGLGNFGVSGSNSGIALVKIERTPSTITLTPLDASTGMDGNKAMLLDGTSSVLTGSADFVTFLTGTDANNVAFYFDQTLNLLYAGVRIQTSGNVGDIGKAILIGDLDDANALTLRPIVPNSALDADNRIVVALVNTPNQPAALSIKHVSVMHASTGPDYLIVNGGEGETSTIGNKIRALPLVNNPGTDTHGTLANKLSPLDQERHVFIVPATTPAGLPLDDDPAAVVGAGNLPIDADADIASMVVVGDTVYISSAVPNDATNNAGIFYSRAQFDKEGKILSWTPWTKKALPQNAFPGIDIGEESEHDGPINQFAVDARTGLIWFVEGNTNKNAGITTWETTNGSNGLMTALNAVLSHGAYAVLDLDQSTRGFVQSPINPSFAGYRYALFGGSDRVVFATISQSTQTDMLDGAQIITTDFTNPENILVTELPANAGCVTCLEYARQTSAEGNQNYFFAGTDAGLFVFTNNAQEGFSANDLNTLDAEPFVSRSWHKITSISGSIVRLKTSGKKLYVLTQESTDEEPLKAKIYSVPFAPTVSTMFNSARIIAQTNIDVFKNVFQFFDMGLINTDIGSEEKEQLVLATSQGLFFSYDILGVQASTNQTQANWTLIAGTETTLFNGIGQDSFQPLHTLWPFSMQDPDGNKTYTRSNVYQLSGNDDTSEPFTTFAPSSFNALDNPLFTTLDHIYGFWSDGARRFFISQPMQQSARSMYLNVLPFNTAEWYANSFLSLTYGPLSTPRNFYWIQAIGASGIIMAGTNTGVVGLG